MQKQTKRLFGASDLDRRLVKDLFFDRFEDAGWQFTVGVLAGGRHP
ncbi:MAG: hypothetical protein VX549_11405 [Pseudomonadota bacterium]|nr:hypothetical protein [Pseudomonadota bacterium]